MGISPVVAIPKILAETGLTKEDIDVFEVHLPIFLKPMRWLNWSPDQRSLRLSVRILR